MSSEKSKSSLSVISTHNYVILSNESAVVNITKGGHAKSDGVKFDIGVSFKDIKENGLRRKLAKKAERISKAQIDKIVDGARKNVIGSYKQEVLDKLASVGAEQDLVEAVKKALKESHIESLLS